MPLINIQNLVKHYGPIRAVDDLSFGVEAGTITGFRDLLVAGGRDGKLVSSVHDTVVVSPDRVTVRVRL